jgi:hypothetical protein
MSMNDRIISTLKMYYGVTECVVYDVGDNQLEVKCVGGDVDYVCVALEQMCDTDNVKLVSSDGKGYLICVNL